MPVRVWKIFIWLLGAVGTSSVAFAQESAIELGKKNIALDEPFAITLVIREAQDQHTYSPFPDIAGMQKREVTTVNLKEGSTGKYIISQRITQYYLAAKTGKFTLPPFPHDRQRQGAALPRGSHYGGSTGPGRASRYVASRLYNEIMGMERRWPRRRKTRSWP
jgi:hypothetical protein